MGESACLLRGYSSQDSDTGPAAGKGNPVLEGSVSFGRFASESLAWEKWSSFSHNRYMEEVSKYSTPGSVAQKKAYFEAHYKRIAAAKKAAALLEQDNTAPSADDVPKQEAVDELQSAEPPESLNQLAESANHVDEEKPDGVEILITENSASLEANLSGLGVVAQDLHKEMVEEGNDEERDEVEALIIENSGSAEASESSLGEIAHDRQEETLEDGNVLIMHDSLAEAPMLVEPLQKSELVENNLVATDMLGRKTEQLKELIPKECATSIQKSSLKEKKPKLSVLKSSIRHITSKLIPSTPTRPRWDNCVTPNTKSCTRDSLEKKRSAPKPLHMSINSPPWCISQTSATATKKKPSTIQEKPQVPKTARSSSQPSFFSLSAQKAKSPTSVSVDQSLKHPLATPTTETKRKGSTSELVTPTSRLLEKTWQSWSTDRSKPTTSVHNTRSPTVPVAFSFKSDERAAKRKEYYLKLEEKFNVEAQKLQLQAKPKGQVERKCNALSQSIGFKAKPMPDFYYRTADNQVKKIPPTLPLSANLGRKSSCAAAQEVKPQPPPRPPVKSDVSKNRKEKNIQTSTCSFTSLRKEKVHENTSPNIQS